MKNNTQKYRNENWSVITGDHNNSKHFSDERFYITFHAYTNVPWYNPVKDPFESMPQIYIWPKEYGTFFDVLLDDAGGVKILLN